MVNKNSLSILLIKFIILFNSITAYAASGSISGRVVDSANQPIANLEVTAYDFDTWDWIDWGETNTTGRYLIKDLRPGTYIVEVNTFGTEFAGQYFNNATTMDTANPVTVKGGAVTPNIDFVLVIGGSISGKVVDSANQPIADLFVDVRDFTTGFLNGTNLTDTTGSYLIKNLPPGTYRVGVSTQGTAFAAQYFNNATWDTANPVTVTGGAVTPNIDFVLVKSGSISGRVVDSANQPIANLYVDAYDFTTGDWIDWGKTDTTGRYLIKELPPGTYIVGMDVLGTEFVRQYFNNATTMDTANPVTVTGGAVTPNINFVLVIGGSISGKVVDSANQPIADLYVDVYDFTTGDWIDYGRTDTSGSYLIKNFPPGTYIVGVDALGTEFIGQYFNNATWDTANPVTVTGGAVTPNINFTLSTGNYIKGKVKDTDNDPLPNLFVDVFVQGTENWVGGELTDENGDYAIPLPPGTYRVEVETFGTNFAPAPRPNVVVIAGSDTTGINFTLPAANKIKGRVTAAGGAPLPFMFVDVSESATWGFWNYGQTDVNGDYAITVPPGDYLVEVDTSGTIFVKASTTVTMTAGADVIGVDFTLSGGSLIMGRVTDNVNNPVQGIFVSAYESSSGYWIKSDETDISGDYAIPMPPGTYKVGVETFGTAFAMQWYNNKGWNDADSVTVLSGQDTPDINFSLQTASVITGNITDGTQPLGNVFVDAFDFDTGFWVSYGLSDAGGTYTVSVRPGRYKLGTFALEQGFADEFYNDKGALEMADLVTVPQEGISGIDFVLTRGGSISGNVSAAGAGGLANIDVNAFDFNSDLWIRGTMTAGNGNYTIDGLPAGTYRLWAFDPSGVYPSEFYDGADGATAWNLSIPVTAANEDNVPNINFTFSQGGEISGQVTDGTSGLGTITVEAYEFNNGQWSNNTDTDSQGNYAIILPAGSYKLRAFDPGGTYTASYFGVGTVSSWHEAGSVTVTSGQDTPNINFTLAQGLSISGKVTDDTSKPIKGIDINIFDFDTGAWIDSTVTDVDGKYKLTASAGKYRAGAFPSDPRFTTAFYNNVSSWDEASPLSVSASSSTQNINFRLFGGGKIAGKVINTDNNPLPGINVQIFNFDTDSLVNDRITDSNGDFSITVPAGRYRLKALPLDVTTSVSGEFYDDTASWDDATDVTVVNGQTTTLNDIVLGEGQSVSGSVLDTQGAAVSGAVIKIFDYDTGSWVNSTVTDKQGLYALKGVKGGSYRLMVSPPPGGNLAGIFFDNASVWDDAKRLIVATADRVNINPTLPVGGLISGKITDTTSGNAIAGSEVNVHDLETGAWVNNGITDGTGAYSIKVPPGTYLVRTAASKKGFVDEFFDNTTERDLASPVIVTTAKAGNANFQLAQEGKIKGRVIDTNGTGISGARVNAHNFDSGAWTNVSVTESSGAFSISLPSGRYWLQVSAPPGSNFVDEFFNDVTDPNLATAVDVTPPNDTTLADISLSTGRGFITGSIMGTNTASLEGIKVNVINSKTNLQAGFGLTDANGSYTVSVAPGSYLVFTSSKGTSTAFVDEFFDNVTNVGSATAVNVVSGVTKSVSFVLDTGSNIKGRVRSKADLKPLAGVEVQAFLFDTARKVEGANTDSNGVYSIRVPNGTYRVWAFPKNVKRGNTTFQSQFFSNTESFDKAKNVIISGADKTDVDFDLAAQ